MTATPSVTARLMLSLEAIRFELGRVRDTLQSPEASLLPRDDVRLFRVEAERLIEGTNKLLDWLSEARIEEPRH